MKRSTMFCNDTDTMPETEIVPTSALLSIPPPALRQSDVDPLLCGSQPLPTDSPPLLPSYSGINENNNLYDSWDRGMVNIDNDYNDNWAQFGPDGSSNHNDTTFHQHYQQVVNNKQESVEEEEDSRFLHCVTPKLQEDIAIDGGNNDHRQMNLGLISPNSEQLINQVLSTDPAYFDLLESATLAGSPANNCELMGDTFLAADDSQQSFSKNIQLLQEFQRQQQGSTTTASMQITVGTVAARALSPLQQPLNEAMSKFLSSSNMYPPPRGQQQQIFTTNTTTMITQSSISTIGAQTSILSSPEAMNQLELPLTATNTRKRNSSGNKEPCMSKNAQLARANREKKKEEWNMLIKRNSELEEENAALKKLKEELQLKVADRNTHIKRLETVLSALPNIATLCGVINRFDPSQQQPLPPTATSSVDNGSFSNSNKNHHYHNQHHQ